MQCCARDYRAQPKRRALYMKVMIIGVEDIEAKSSR